MTALPCLLAHLQADRLTSSALPSELAPQSCSSRAPDSTRSEFRGCQRHGILAQAVPRVKNAAQFHPSVRNGPCPEPSS